MRWIVGNIPAHFDTSSQSFDNTYLVYLNDSGGNLIIADVAYSIAKNKGFCFNFQEGLQYYTDNVYDSPRLLLGLMNS
jgi:hypothetical protein